MIEDATALPLENLVVNGLRRILKKEKTQTVNNVSCDIFWVRMVRVLYKIADAIAYFDTRKVHSDTPVLVWFFRCVSEVLTLLVWPSDYCARQYYLPPPHISSICLPTGEKRFSMSIFRDTCGICIDSIGYKNMLDNMLSPSSRHNRNSFHHQRKSSIS